MAVLSINEGIGAGLHPEDITKKNLLILKDTGINMVSLGVQSFNKNCLNMIGSAGAGDGSNPRSGFDFTGFTRARD
jgi:hypothetical protein